MEKGFIFGLLVLAGFSNAAFAAPTTLSTVNTFQTGYGWLIGFEGRVGTASWNYDTDLSKATSITTTVLTSGATITTYKSVDHYTLTGSGTAAGDDSFEGETFSFSVINNLAATDIAEIPNSALSLNEADLTTMMEKHSLNPNDAFDMVLFDINHPRVDIPEIGVYLSGLSIFKNDFFSGPITTLPTAEEILSQSLFSYGILNIRDILGANPTSYGHSSFAVSPSAVPVPAAAILFAPALLGFLGLRRKAKNSVA